MSAPNVGGKSKRYLTFAFVTNMFNLQCASATARHRVQTAYAERFRISAICHRKRIAREMLTVLLSPGPRKLMLPPESQNHHHKDSARRHLLQMRGRPDRGRIFPAQQE